LFLDLGHGDRHQPLFAQLVAHLAGRVALDDAAALLAGGIQRGVFEGTHRQSSRVTRSTSSMVVVPDRIFARPSSRIDGVSVRAYRSSSCSAAPSWIIVRRWSSTSTSS